jgi:hypothetical protein
MDSDWIPDLFAMEIYSCYTNYNYGEHYSTGSFLNPDVGTALTFHFDDSLMKTDFGDRLTHSRTGVN